MLAHTLTGTKLGSGEATVFELPEPVSFLNLNVGEGVTVSDNTDHVTLKN